MGRVLIGLVLISAILLTPLAARATAPRNPARDTARQWRAAYAATRDLPLAARVLYWADRLAAGSAYVADPLGEGEGHPPDTDPLHDFARVDCVTYVEQVYALALAPNRAGFDDVLRRIRYREGRVDFRWRNHYFVSDWLPANAWFIRDVTEQVAPDHTRVMTKTISRATFFTGKGLPQYGDLPDEQAVTRYIPRDQVAAITGQLRDGDVVVFVIDTPGIIAGHTGLLRVQDGGVLLRHASTTAKRVVTVPLLDYLAAAPARVVGVKIARPATSR